MRLFNSLTYLRLRPFAQDTEAGRAAERYRRVLLTILASFSARGMGLLVMIIAVNLTVPYLGTERFGAWMTIASLAAMLNFLDFGIGNALTNQVARAATMDTKHHLTTVISGGLGVLCIVSLILMVLLTGIAAALPWSSIIKLQSQQLTDEVRQTAIVFAALFGASTFANGVSRVYFGLQRGFEAHFAGTLGSLGSLVALYFSAQAQAGLPVLLSCTMLGTMIANLALLPRLLLKGHFSIAKWNRSIRTESTSLLRHGSIFFLLQIGTMVGWGADSLIIANATGTTSVATYAVIQRLTLLISQPLAIVNAPLWSAYADAHARGERSFIRRTFKRSFTLTLSLSTLGALLVFSIGQDVTLFWTHAQIKPETGLLLVMAIWVILEATGNSLGVLLNGLGIVKQQVWVVIAFVLLALPIKLWLAPIFGAIGVVAAGIFAYLITTVSSYCLIFRKDLVERIR